MINCSGFGGFCRKILGLAVCTFICAGEAQCQESCLGPFSETDCCPSCDDGGWCCFDSDRTTLTGDWAGFRPGLVESGVNFQADVTQFYYGVVSGGVEQRFRYSGHGDYVLNIDAGKLGLQPGWFLKVKAEHRFGNTIGEEAGTLYPPTVLSDLPSRETEELLLTNVLLTKALSPNLLVFGGKLDTLDGDMNTFAHGRGKTQFSHSAMVINPIALRTVPYSTLGAGFAWLEEGEPLFTFMVLNPTDTVNTTGFDELFSEGVSLAAELRLPTEFFGLPGHQLFAGTWSSRNYVALGQDPRIILPEVPINEASGSWSLYWNFDQYLVVDRCDSSKGWGIFGRAGIADDEANPVSYFLSLGIGGNSPVPGRSDDTFGAGWFYSGTSDEIGPLLTGALGPVSDGQGVELFYRTQITPWFHITPDLQILMPARENVSTALVAGLRANLSF